MPFLYTDGWGKLLICLLTYLLAAYGVARKVSKRTRISQMQRIGLFTDRFHLYLILCAYGADLLGLFGLVDYTNNVMHNICRIEVNK